MKRSEKVERNRAICEAYEQIKNQPDALDRLASKYQLCVPYVKNILKDRGAIEVRVKTKSAVREQRDSKIVADYVAGLEPVQIAEQYGVTTTRVGQIVRDHLGRNARANMLERDLDAVRVDLDAGMSHRDVLQKYGASLLRKLKDNLGFNAFDQYVERRNQDIINRYATGVTAMQIAKEFDLTRDHVYGILHRAGIRTKHTRDEYADRNRQIIDQFKRGAKSQDLAEQYGMTVTNVNIIIKKHGGR